MCLTQDSKLDIFLMSFSYCSFYSKACTVPVKYSPFMRPIYHFKKETVRARSQKHLRAWLNCMWVLYLKAPLGAIYSTGFSTWDRASVSRHFSWQRIKDWVHYRKYIIPAVCISLMDPSKFWVNERKEKKQKTLNLKQRNRSFPH